MSPGLQILAPNDASGAKWLLVQRPCLCEMKGSIGVSHRYFVPAVFPPVSSRLLPPAAIKAPKSPICALLLPSLYPVRLESSLPSPTSSSFVLPHLLWWDPPSPPAPAAALTVQITTGSVVTFPGYETHECFQKRTRVD